MDYGTRWPYLQIGTGTSYDLILIVIGRLTSVMTRAGLPMSTDGKDMNYNLTLVIVALYDD